MLQSYYSNQMPTGELLIKSCNDISCIIRN